MLGGGPIGEHHGYPVTVGVTRTSCACVEGRPGMLDPAAMMATSRSGAMPNPELSRLMPPMKWTGCPPEYGQPDVVDHLALIVLVDGDGPGALGRLGHGLRSGTATG